MIEDKAVVASADTVNGSITVGAEAEVRADVDTVNGSLTLRKGARVGGKLENVNGTLMLDGAQVHGGIETVNGDVRHRERLARRRRHPRREEPVGWNWGKQSRNPRITIESGATVWVR